MVQELLFKLIGSGISLLVYFLPIAVEYSNSTLSINVQLKDPITNEIQSLVADGHIFRINYSFSVIINNNQKAYERTVLMALTRLGSTWYVNNNPVDRNEIQKAMGAVFASIKDVKFDNSDKVKIIIKAQIPHDTIFTKSTGLQPSIVWNYYTPRIQNVFVFSKEEFTRE